jgi:hypothetical protein
METLVFSPTGLPHESVLNMAHDSDTESEPESSSLQSSIPIQVGNITGTAADVKTAVETLKCLEGHNIQQV